MATKKTASKTTQKAKLNLGFGLDEQPKKSSKRKQNKVKKTVKKFGILPIVVAVLFLAIGAGAGWFATKMICKNDCFTLVGKDEISIELGSSYIDQGVNIVAFGKDETASVEIETNLTKNSDGSYTSTEQGTFYIKYKSNCFKYGKLFKVERIRLISFVEASDTSDIFVD